eukprot:TRINITY_DN1196_c0_g2_i1.p1 TRINITY_DN1196_c0_g2~~TRINITY_DN1196_c0_g2_i1.p1  ORF type:complete len:126 (-),score=7.11 TRINITY_DN1196_c0_g2_i1:35-412(-)
MEMAASSASVTLIRSTHPRTRLLMPLPGRLLSVPALEPVRDRLSKASVGTELTRVPVFGQILGGAGTEAAFRQVAVGLAAPPPQLQSTERLLQVEPRLMFQLAHGVVLRCEPQFMDVDRAPAKTT